MGRSEDETVVDVPRIVTSGDGGGPMGGHAGVRAGIAAIVAELRAVAADDAAHAEKHATAFGAHADCCAEYAADRLTAAADRIAAQHGPAPSASGRERALVREGARSASEDGCCSLSEEEVGDAIAAVTAQPDPGVELWTRAEVLAFGERVRAACRDNVCHGIRCGSVCAGPTECDQADVAAVDVAALLDEEPGK